MFLVNCALAKAEMTNSIYRIDFYSYGIISYFVIRSELYILRMLFCRLLELECTKSIVMSLFEAYAKGQRI